MEDFVHWAWLLIYAAHAFAAWRDWMDGDPRWMAALYVLVGLMFLFVTTGCPLFAMALMLSAFSCIGRLNR